MDWLRRLREGDEDRDTSVTSETAFDRVIHSAASAIAQQGGSSSNGIHSAAASSSRHAVQALGSFLGGTAATATAAPGTALGGNSMMMMDNGVQNLMPMAP